MLAFRRLLKGIIAKSGYELCRLSSAEAEELPKNISLNYKEAQCYRALSKKGQISLREARFLGELVRACDPSRPIIEIGTLFGHSTSVIALFKDQKQELISVDSFVWNPLGISSETHRTITYSCLKEARDEHNTQLIYADKEEFYQKYNGPAPSLFFCDANHSREATFRDIEWARSMSASIICGDDYDLGNPSPVAQAVDEHGGAAKIVGGMFML